jgi:hypothetical protein
VRLVVKDSATLEDRDVRRQAGVLARGLQQLADLPMVCPTSDREADRSIVLSQHHQLAPHGLQQRFHHIQMPVPHPDARFCLLVYSCWFHRSQSASPARAPRPPADLQQRFHHLQMSLFRTDREAAGSLLSFVASQLAPHELQIFSLH